MSVDIPVTEGRELIIPGSDPIVYDKILIQSLLFDYKEDGRIVVQAGFRYYRLLEDGTSEWAPVKYNPPIMTLNDLREILGDIPGGADLKDAVSEAIIGIAKMQGIL